MLTNLNPQLIVVLSVKSVGWPCQTNTHQLGRQRAQLLWCLILAMKSKKRLARIKHSIMIMCPHGAMCKNWC